MEFAQANNVTGHEKSQDALAEPVNPTPLRFKPSHACGETTEREAESHRRKRRRHLNGQYHSGRATSSGGKKPHHSHHKSHRHHRNPKPSEHFCPEPQEADRNGDPIYHDSHAAFRESLFDAMADDEGASYWEGIYGQPIHIFSKMKRGATGTSLEEMTDEEYVSYVRARMWEKTGEHIIEERRKREAESEQMRKQRKRAADMASDSSDFQARLNDSLRRGQQRSRRKRWEDAWAAYEEGWRELRDCQGQTPQRDMTQRIPWPVKSGRIEDINVEEVENFFRNGHEHSALGDLTGLLKSERVRWHPDKMTQRVGKLDDRSTRAVTAVFQFLDDLFSKAKG